MDVFGFVNNFFSLFEPAENGAIPLRKFDDVFREGSGNDLEHGAASGARDARFPSRVTIFSRVNDDRGPTNVFLVSENEDFFCAVNFFFNYFFGAWNIRNVVEHFNLI